MAHSSFRTTLPAMKDERDGCKRTIAQALVDAGVLMPPSTALAPTTATNANAVQRAYAPSSKTTPTPATHTSCSDEDQTMVKFDNQTMIAPPGCHTPALP